MNNSRYRAAVFGASSAIVTGILRALVAERPAELLLLGRNRSKIEAVANDLSVRGAVCTVLAADLLDPAVDWGGHLAGPPWDLLLLGHGSLPDQECALASGEAVAHEIAVNFTSQAVIAAACAGILARQDYGTLAVIGSVAGDRGRQSNFLYGSAKAGIATFLDGLRHRFAANPRVHIVLLKPGITDTPMTAGLRKGLLCSPAGRVGQLAWDAIRRGKDVAYLPWWWRWVMLVIRRLPRAVFHRTKL